MYINSKMQMCVSKSSTHRIATSNAHLVGNARSKPALMFYPYFARVGYPCIQIGVFDLLIETVHYLVEFRIYDLRQTLQIFIAVAFRLCKSSLQ